jgi:hypothetical protein
LVAFDRLFIAPQPRERDGQMMVGVGRTALDLDGPAEQICGIAEPPLLEPKQAQAVKRIKISVVCVKHDPVALFRFPKPPLGMECGCFLKHPQGIDDPPIRE